MEGPRQPADTSFGLALVPSIEISSSLPSAMTPCCVKAAKLRALSPRESGTTHASYDLLRVRGLGLGLGLGLELG